MRPRSLFPALILGLLAFLAYRFTAAPSLLPGDSGEFQLTLATLGLSHPTGYPLYHLLGWLWDRLYLSNPAQGANHFSALWGGIAVALFYLLAYEVLSQLLARLKWRAGAGWLAGITTIFFAANPTFWAQATHAEVYTLHAALVAGLLGATVAVGRSDIRLGSLWPVALMLGLALAHHLTALLLLPAIFIYLLISSAQAQGNAVTSRRLLRLAPFLFLPLLLYLYVPLRGPQTPWMHPTLISGETLQLFDNSILGNIRHILGVGFAPALRGPGAAFAQIPEAANLFLIHFTWPGLILIALGLVALILEEKLPLLIFTLIAFLSLLIFNLFYGIGDIYPFYIPAYLIATLWLGLGLAYLIDLISRITAASLRPILMALALALLAIPYLHFQNYSANFDRRDEVATAFRWQQILAAGLPDDAVLVSNDRDEIVPLLYLQYIDKQATGMNSLFPLISPAPQWADLHTTLDAALASARPIYTIKAMPGLEALYKTEPLTDDITRVLARHPTPDPSFEAPYGDYLRWLNLDWWGDAEPGGTITVEITWRVTQPPPTTWHTFLQIYNEAGERVKQADDHRPGGLYLPSPLWRPGDVVVDTFTLPLPDDLPPGGYTIVAGFYDPVADERMAEPLPVATLLSPSSRTR